MTMTDGGWSQAEAACLSYWLVGRPGLGEHHRCVRGWCALTPKRAAAIGSRLKMSRLRRTSKLGRVASAVRSNQAKRRRHHV